MSDPTDTGQRNPLSSSSSHASGTSARSVSVQADQPAQSVTGMAPQDDVTAPVPAAGGEPDQKVETVQAETSQLEPAGWNDETAAQAAEQQDLALESEADAEYSEAVVEQAASAAADELLSAASTGSTAEAADEVSAFVDETVSTTADDEPADALDTAADLDAASPETSSEEDPAPDAPVQNGTSSDPVAELRAAARQKLAENEARQEKAMALFDQVSRRFTAALEEAGVDAARVTFKVMEFAQASLKNNLELAKSYTAARSVPDIFGLHAAYLTRQFELLNAQAEELREITAKFGVRNAAALKPIVDPAVKTLDNR